MSTVASELRFDWEQLLANITTEDDEPVDNPPSATQQRLLVTPLHDSWTPPPSEDEPEAKRKYLATATPTCTALLMKIPIVENFPSIRRLPG